MPGNDISIGGDGIPLQSIDNTPITVTPSPQGLSSTSTLAPSAEQAIIDSWDAQIPFIPPPSFFNFTPSNSDDVVLFAMKVDNAINQAAIDMLDKWNESIKELSEKRRRESLSPEQARKDEERREVSGFASNYVANSDPAKDGLIPIVTVGLIFSGVGGVRDAIVIDTQSTKMVGANPISEQDPKVLMQPDMREWLSILGAALVQGMTYAANTFALAKTDGTEPGKQNQLSAEQYADLALNIAKSGELNSIITGMVQSKTPGQPVDKEYVKSLELKMKVFLLGTALAALYSAGKGGTDHLISEELAGLLTGENETFGPNKEKMDEVITVLKQQLAGIQDPGDRDRILQSLFAFIDTSPTAEVLMNPAKSFPQFGKLNRNPGETPT